MSPNRFFASTAAAAILVGCATAPDRGRRAPNSLTMTDLELACRFAPIVVNELSPKGYTYDGIHSDQIVEVSYDAAETASHVFLQYTVIKPWSEFDLKVKSVNMHFLDTEDVFYVLRKGAGEELVPVYFSSNAHGNRLYYIHPQADFDPGELKAAVAATRKLEGNDGSAASAFEAFRSRGSSKWKSGKPYPEAAPYLGERPYLFSKAMDHALTHADPGVLASNLALVGKGFELGVADCDGTNELAPKLGIEPARLTRYRFRPVTEVATGMTFSEEAQTASAARTEPCRERTVRLDGVGARLREIPRFLDPKWYLRDRGPFMEHIRTRFGAEAYTAMLGDLKGSLTHTKEYPANDELLCPRLDPAKVFTFHFPKTAELQKSSPDYLRHAFGR